MAAREAGKERKPGFCFLICPDAELLRERLELWLKKFPPASGERERLLFWGDEEPEARFWDSLVQQGLFAAPRAVIVRRANEWKAGIWKNLSGTLARVPEAIWPFLCLEVGFERGKFKIPAHIQKSRCYSFAEKNGWIWSDKGLGEGGLARFVAEKAKKAGAVFAPEAMRLFCEGAAPDAAAITNELEKLALAANGAPIGPEMISQSFGMLETDAFTCIRKLEAGDIAGAWSEVAKGSANEPLFLFIALLSREFRQLWQILAGENPRMHPAEASRKRSLAISLGRARVAKGFSALADAEWQVKSGRRSPGQALEFLLSEVCGIFRRAATPGP